jgi:hypothetical protein
MPEGRTLQFNILLVRFLYGNSSQINGALKISGIEIHYRLRDVIPKRVIFMLQAKVIPNKQK